MAARVKGAEELLREAERLYAKHGQGAVEEWAQRPEVKGHVNWRACVGCEEVEPHVGEVCAVCESTNGAAPEADAALNRSGPRGEDAGRLWRRAIEAGTDEAL